MKGVLTQTQIDYVLFHLKQHVVLPDGFEKFFQFGGATTGLSKQAFFPLSDKEMNPIEIQFQSEGLLVLFPVDRDGLSYSIIKDSLLFHHDFIKSAFYLLSACQELSANNVDEMDRYRYQGSVQEKWNVVTKPLVNYYFEIIIQGLEVFADLHQLKIKRKKLFDNFGFMLTHDVDRIDYYHWRETIYKWMQIVGLKPRHYSKKRLVKAAVDAILPTFFPGYKPDPWWNFKELRKQERTLGLKSVWYFLNRDGSPHDAKYNLEEKRIKELVIDLQAQQCEVGLHGSIKTANSQVDLQKALERVQKISGKEIVGTRQHFLKFHYSQTLQHQQTCGLQYDSSMGFAEHEGFRNGYCYPFHPYDHEKQEMMQIWEMPLVLMDTTLFGYRELEYSQMMESVEVLINEVCKFGGLFVLLWHNCNFNEYQYPGINEFYGQLLAKICSSGHTSVTGVDVLERLD